MHDLEAKIISTPIFHKFDELRRRYYHFHRAIRLSLRHTPKLANHLTSQFAPSEFLTSFKLEDQSRTAHLQESAMDGAADKLLSKATRAQSQMPAIFVHAGAGYHSTTNEHIHLAACNE
jgi:hypothetical protein